jgi:8-oxo-dGTP pyrophosphatase MutT (NUDIX family)
VVRDAPALEVLMLRRNARSTFVGGGMVFPGGAVDPHDHEPGLAAVSTGRPADVADATLRVPGGGLAYWAAAVRETFEEAGLLLACSASAEAAARLAHQRREVEDGRRHLADLAAAEGLVFDLGGLHYFGHWITPTGQHRRYDTRFFVAAAPAGQEPLHDDREADAWEWVRPTAMLDRLRTGDAWMLPPTEACLRALTEVPGASALLDDLAGRPAGPPRLVADWGGVRVRLAHDPAVLLEDDADEIHDPWEPRCPT